MKWYQNSFTLPGRNRGCHLITKEVIDGNPQLREIEKGLFHLFIQHTSASLALNENTDPDVLRDMENAIRRMIPDDASYIHRSEGPDDMPAHVKNTLIGCDITVPITGGDLNLGTWQGIYLLEHRNGLPRRSFVATILGI